PSDSQDLYSPFIAFPFFPQRSLPKALQNEALRGRLQELDKLRLLAQVARTIAVGHQHGLFHRDIRGANVLIGAAADGSLAAFVTDYGLSEVREVGAATPSAETATMIDFNTPTIAENGQPTPRELERQDLQRLGLLVAETYTERFRSLPHLVA